MRILYMLARPAVTMPTVLYGSRHYTLKGGGFKRCDARWQGFQSEWRTAALHLTKAATERSMSADESEIPPSGLVHRLRRTMAVQHPEDLARVLGTPGKRFVEGRQVGDGCFGGEYRPQGSWSR